MKFMLIALVICLSVANVSCDKSVERKSYALVNGERIFEDEVLDADLIAQIQVLEAQILQLKVHKTDAIIQQRLLTQQSKKLGLSEDEILNPFESLKGAPISAEEMERVRQHLGRMDAKIPWTQVLDDVRAGRVVEARRRFLSELRSRATVKNLLVEPQSENTHRPPD
jgi:hypothetical protein